MKRKTDVVNRLRALWNIGTVTKLLFTAFLLVSLTVLGLGGGKYTELSYAENMSLASFALCLTLYVLALTALEVFLGKYKVVEWTMLVATLLLSLLLVSGAGNEIQYHVYAAVLIIFAIILNYLVGAGLFDGEGKALGERAKWGIIAVFATVACVIVAAIGVYRYLTFATPNFDFGIWCNMFHNMKHGGLPVTTCERDGLLSHFAVHFSPIYYVMLPFYAVFPSPITLQILQAVVLYSGVIPLCMMAKDKGLSNRATVVLGFIYSFYPAIATGTFYDLHENCFLVPLLLWCFCFFEKEKPLPMWICAGLTLLVKEDAFIYLLIFAVYVFFVGKKKRTAIALALTAILYFAVVSSLMTAYGNGVMVGRYDNLIADNDDGLLGVVKTALFNPGYLLTQLFVSKDGDASKIVYLLQLVFTLGLIPFATKKISRYVLVAPVLMNLITMYVYQPNIKFQYSFGITAFLFYVTLLNLSELGEKARKFMLPFSAVASFLLFSVLVVGFLGHYADRYANSGETYKQMDRVLEEVLPEDASVTCSTFLLPHIADRDEIYEATYHKEQGKYKTDTEYVALDMRYKEESESAAEFFLANGYEEYHNDGGYVVILKKVAAKTK